MSQLKLTVVPRLVYAFIIITYSCGSHVLQESKHSTNKDQTAEDLGQPAPCCLPYRFQAVVANLPGFSADKKVVARISRDWEKRIQVQESVTFNSGGIEKVISQTFMDYKHMVQYLYTPGGPCQTTALDHGMLEPCMPENASYIGQSYIGAYSEKINFNAWNFRRTNFNRNIEITIAVTEDKCVPVSEHITGQIGTSQVDVLVLFMNVTEHVEDMVFDIPLDCVGVQQM